MTDMMSSWFCSCCENHCKSDLRFKYKINMQEIRQIIQPFQNCSGSRLILIQFQWHRIVLYTYFYLHTLVFFLFTVVLQQFTFISYTVTSTISSRSTYANWQWDHSLVGKLCIMSITVCFRCSFLSNKNLKNTSSCCLNTTDTHHTSL